MEYQFGLICALDYAQGIDSRAGLADAEAKAVSTDCPIELTSLADEREAAVRSENQKHQLERTVASRRQQR